VNLLIKEEILNISLLFYIKSITIAIVGKKYIHSFDSDYNSNIRIEGK